MIVGPFSLPPSAFLAELRVGATLKKAGWKACPTSDAVTEPTTVGVTLGNFEEVTDSSVSFQGGIDSQISGNLGAF
jgi:hypothetical protein